MDMWNSFPTFLNVVLVSARKCFFFQFLIRMTGKLFSSNDMILRKKINFENVVAFITRAVSRNRQEYDNYDIC